MALLNFDASTVAPSTGREPIPAGLYLAKIVAAELKPTNDGTGTRLNLQFKVMQGEFEGRIVFHGLNIKNKSEQAQKIAQGELSAICHSVNVIKLTNTDQLLEKPLRIKVKIKAAQFEGGAEKYPARNEIDSFESATAKAPAGAAGPGRPGAAQAPAAAAQGQRPAAAAGTKPAGFGNRPTTAAPAAAQGGEQQAPVTGQRTRPATRPAPAPAPAPVVEEEVVYDNDGSEGEYNEQVDENGNYAEHETGVDNDQPWE